MTLKETESIDETNKRTTQTVEYNNIRINHKTKLLELAIGRVACFVQLGFLVEHK